MEIYNVVLYDWCVYIKIKTWQFLGLDGIIKPKGLLKPWPLRRQCFPTLS